MNLKNKKLGFVATSMVAALLLTSSADDLQATQVSFTAEAGSKTLADGKIEKSAFTDVVGQSAEALAINKLVEQGYIKAKTSKFNPQQPISLQHLAQLMTDTGLVKQVNIEGVTANPYMKSIQGLINMGALPSNTDITDEAVVSKKVTQGEYEQILKAVFKLSGDENLVKLGVVSEGDYNPNKEITRGDFAVQLHALLKNSGVKPTAKVAMDNVVASVTPVAIDKSVASTKATTTKRFKDVSPDSTHSHAIHAMRDMGIIYGYGDNTFKPNEPINRANGAALITRYIPMKYEGTAKFPTLSDVTTKNANYTVLVEFQKLGIYKTNTNNKIFPTLAMTRAEMAKSIAMAFELPIVPTKKSSFTDVKASDPFSPYIEAMYKAGLTTGYGDGTFKPKTSLSRAHFSSFMYRAIEKVGKPTDEQPTTNPPVVEEKPVTPPTTGGNTGGGTTVKPPSTEKPSVGDFTKPTEYTGDFKYTNDGKIKFEDKKLEDFPLYSMPDIKNDMMYLNGLTRIELGEKNQKELDARKGEISSTGVKKISLRFSNGDLEAFTKRVLAETLKPYGFTEAESYQFMTYLYYSGDSYKSDKLTAFMNYPQKSGEGAQLVISLGKL